jgi:tRNA dimethylallyltransferase
MKTVIIISGPTASGKTSTGIQVAKHFGTEIISADSRQCYKELNIGVARPSEKELHTVPHYFIATHSVHQKVTAAVFEEYAIKKCTELFNKYDTVVMVGGTGLYIKAFCEGLDEIPEIPEIIRNKIITSYNKNGMKWLQLQVRQLDPLFYDKGENKNPQRLMRALEVVTATGQSILSFQKRKQVKRNFNIKKLAIDISKEQLLHNINQRVDLMMEAGLENEVKSLIPYQHLHPLQTVGYNELFNYFNGETSLAEAVELIKKNTRQYAKRQLTWFRKDKEYLWTSPDKLLSTLNAK